MRAACLLVNLPKHFKLQKSFIQYEAMAYHPLNLVVRFLLEVITLFAVGLWGWEQGESWWRFVLAFGIPLGLAVIWGVFAVPDDPSRSGEAAVVTPGFVRLIIELAFFGFGIWALYDLGVPTIALIVGIVVVLHYSISFERIKWLLSK